MKFLTRSCSHLLDEECCNKFFHDFDFGDSKCISLLMSKCIGFGLIGFSAILKLPQIIQILKSRSGSGLSITSLYMEIIANVLAFAYHRQRGFPFSTFGETIMILIQNLMIAFFVTHFEEKYNFLIWNSFVLSNSCLIFAVEHKLICNSFMSALWGICLPLSIAYKFPQILHTYRSKCKGELSALSCFLTLMGSCGRVFTTIREINDKSVLIMYLLNVLLNGTIWIQSLIYPKKVNKDK